jgi:ABC-type amino acid transport substrate-binding protein
MRSRWMMAVAMFTAAMPAVGGAADLDEIVARGVVRVLVNPDVHRPEFFSLQEGVEPGFDQELLQGFARLNRVKLEPVTVSGWDALIPALLAGQGDLIAGRFTATAARRQQINFTSEVFPYRLVVLTRRPAPPIKTIEQLRAARIGTTRGSSMAEALRAAGIPDANLDEAIPTGGYPEALRARRVTAAVWGVESAIVSQKEDPALELGMFLGPPGSLAWGVRKQDAALLQHLNEYIENTRRSATWSRLVVKYFGAAAPEVLRKARATDQ